MLKGYTHICIHPIDPDDDTGTPRFCHEPIALIRPHGTWIQTGAQRHVEREHGDAPASIESAERAEKREEQKVRQQLLVENPLAPSQQTTLRAEFTLTKEQAELSSQAAWYVYATMHVSKQAFDDKYWKGMMNTAGAKCLINRQQLRKWVRAEFSVFKLFLRYMIERKCMQAQGNAYAQFLHDGGTLASHRKYQALGMQFLSPDWDRNFVICFGFPRSKHNKDVEVAELAVIQFMSMSGYAFEYVFGSTIADRAAKGVASYLNHEEEVCGMHDGDKLGQSATGALTRSKNHTIVNPFPEAVKHADVQCAQDGHRFHVGWPHRETLGGRH